MNKILGIAAAIIIAAFGLAIWGYGNARYDAGKADCRSENTTAVTEAASESAKNLEKTTNETARMSDADVDADLYRLGIMRPSHAR